MATPAQATDIANLALRHLQIAPVLSIDPPDDDSKEAAAAAAWYDQARRDTLEAHPWGFARKRASLAADGDDPSFEYDARYELPSDFIRLVRLGEDWDNPELDYEIIGNFIECNVETPLDIVYIYNITDVTKFSPKFVTAMSFKLASLMAYGLTGNAALIDALDGQFRQSLSQATSVSGQNRPTRRVQRSTLREVRKLGAPRREWWRWGND